MSQQDFKEAYEAFRLALIMDPSNKEAANEIGRLGELLKEYVAKSADDGPAADSEGHRDNHAADHGTESGPGVIIDEELEPIEADSDATYDVIIIGGGAAGVGCAFTLTHTFGLDPSRVLIVERGEAIGTSFRMWPEEMRFISPSFNQQGWTNSFDLNSVAYGTSPAYTLHSQHPSGAQYADYLRELAEAAKLNVRTRTEVTQTVPVDGEFDVRVRTSGGGGGGGDGKEEGGELRELKELKEETLRARFVVWAAGEFQYPREKSCDCGMDGAELCMHNSRVRSWASLPGDDFVVIGGYESGVDAAVHLARAGKRTTVLASTATWNVHTADPSTELAPYTADRLRQVTAAGFSPRPTLLAPLRVVRVEQAAGGGYTVVAERKAAEQVQLGGQRKPFASQAEGGGGSADTAVGHAVGDGGGGSEDTSVPADMSVPVGGEGSKVVVHTPQPPLLCTGFDGSVASVASHLFNFADDADEAKGCLAGAALLTPNDESTKVPGVFLVGPSVRHGELSFCFVYKFRQRFGVVANRICRGLGRDTTAAVAECRKTNMYLDDFECCKGSCGEAC